MAQAYQVILVSQERPLDILKGGLTGDEQRKIIRDAAKKAGLKWGGDFKKTDPPHFYYDPGGDRKTLIDQATKEYEKLTKPKQSKVTCK